MSYNCISCFLTYQMCLVSNEIVSHAAWNKNLVNTLEYAQGFYWGKDVCFIN